MAGRIDNVHATDVGTGVGTEVGDVRLPTLLYDVVVLRQGRLVALDRLEVVLKEDGH